MLKKMSLVMFLLIWLSGKVLDAPFAQKTKPGMETSSDEVNARGVWPPSFRVPAKKQPPVKITYKRLPSEDLKGAPLKVRANNTLGLTLWRLRTPQAAEKREIENGRIVVVKTGEQQLEVPERVSINTVFSLGQSWRLGLEVPRAGYLYVIDRERYDNDTLGEPYLIFPLYPQSRDNRIKAGQLTEIPNQTDAKAVFVFQASASGRPLVGEELTIFVTPQPLEGLPAGDGQPIKLDVTTAAALAEWENKFSAATERLEWEGGVGKTYSRAEQQAGKQSKLRLTAADPLPQTIFIVNSKAGAPFFVRLPLRVKE